jgi:ATP diphosphatase
MRRPPADITQLQRIMERLRDPDTGCDWDKKQDFASIAPYTIEEAYEVADAIEKADMHALKDELGDLLLQVVFHSQMAAETGAFELSGVIEAICEKMERRHPHIFGDDNATSPGWDEIKAAERASSDSDTSALSGVARALPALLRAEKIQNRAARVGFDWDNIADVRAKVFEELDEVQQAADQSDQDALDEEIGDLLFATVNLARHYKVDPESSLRRATLKFERRFRLMEAEAGDAFAAMPLDEKEALWQRAKVALKGRQGLG